MSCQSCSCPCVGAHILQVGKPAPEFVSEAVMPNGECSTFVCPTEIIAFDKAVEKFKAIGCEIIGASCDSHFTHSAWIKTERRLGGIGKINYPLIADFTKQLTTKYGCLMPDAGHPARGLYIIDGKGILRNITINDPPVGRNVDEIYRLVEAFKFTDENPGVCPANWVKGDKTIDPKDKNEYFKNAV